MKFKVIFLTKRNIYIALFFIFTFLSLLFIYSLFSQKSYDETSMVMAKKDIEKGVKKDFNEMEMRIFYTLRLKRISIMLA